LGFCFGVGGELTEGGLVSEGRSRGRKNETSHAWLFLCGKKLLGKRGTQGGKSQGGKEGEEARRSKREKEGKGVSTAAPVLRLKNPSFKGEKVKSKVFGGRKKKKRGGITQKKRPCPERMVGFRKKTKKRGDWKKKQKKIKGEGGTFQKKKTQRRV